MIVITADQLTALSIAKGNLLKIEDSLNNNSLSFREVVFETNDGEFAGRFYYDIDLESWTFTSVES